MSENDHILFGDGLGTGTRPSSPDESSIDTYLQEDSEIDPQYVAALAAVVDAGMAEYKKWCAEQGINLGPDRVKKGRIRFRDLLWGAVAVENNRRDVEGEGTDTTISTFDECRAKLVRTREQLKFAMQTSISDNVAEGSNLSQKKLLLIKRAVDQCHEDFPEDFPPAKRIRYTSEKMITAAEAVSLMLLSTQQEEKEGISVNPSAIKKHIDRLVAYVDALNTAKVKVDLIDS